MMAEGSLGVDIDIIIEDDCNVMIVFARIEDDKNITGFIVEYDREN